jgi:hypothetical protein
MPFLGVCVLAFGAVLVSGFIADVVRSSQVRRRGVTVTADVIGINTRVGQASVSRSRVVRFPTARHGEVTVVMPSGQLSDVPVGGRAEIRYLAERPKVARSTDGGVRYISWLFGIVAVIAAGVALLVS